MNPSQAAGLSKALMIVVSKSRMKATVTHYRVLPIPLLVFLSPTIDFGATLLLALGMVAAAVLIFAIIFRNG